MGISEHYFGTADARHERGRISPMSKDMLLDANRVRDWFKRLAAPFRPCDAYVRAYFEST